jgi:hypothetical protein
VLYILETKSDSFHPKKKKKPLPREQQKKKEKKMWVEDAEAELSVC